ncbi:RNA polymerase sigma factor [Haoranjiania flava]|uniref:RNA polymerase sigma-70 factor n=1 Tax=Haoranjiania flava TaxID=1856322 RepID=A0AAE3LQE8_9BACT|nr:RNA polymerase sigma-70 factor [Haoranjiania flava]MCU7694440.1 RNA polymerase sigma-70 factor [Haoranjiania flava]
MNIVYALKEGDEVVFKEVFEEYFGKLYSFIFNRTHSEYLAEEVVQETFIKLWKYRASLNESLSVSIQLFRIARTTLIDQIRKQNNLLSVINTLSDQEVQNATWDTISYNELNNQLQNYIEMMPPMRKKVFILSRIEGWSYKEIAVELAISLKTVEKHISEALKQLRPHLSKINILLILLSYQS